MDWKEILAILVPLLCAIISSPTVIQGLQHVQIVRRFQLENDVQKWVQIACSYAEAWADHQRAANPDISIASSEKLAVARDLVKDGVSAPLDDKEIEARIEHELLERAVRDVVLKVQAAGGISSATIEKG